MFFDYNGIKIEIKNRKQLKGFSVGEQVSKLQYIYTTDYYSEIQEKNPLTYTTWRSPGIILREKKKSLPESYSV